VSATIFILRGIERQAKERNGVGLGVKLAIYLLAIIGGSATKAAEKQGVKEKEEKHKI